MTEFYYIHGFNSFKGGSTGTALSALLPVTQLYYESSKPCEENMGFLKTQVDPACDAVFIGSSLGGFYASQLSCAGIVPRARTLLINPAVNPMKTLSKYIGKNRNFTTGEEYKLTRDTVDSYKKRIDITKEKSSDVPRIILLCDNDEVLDAHEAREYWRGFGEIRNVRARIGIKIMITSQKWQGSCGHYENHAVSSGWGRAAGPLKIALKMSRHRKQRVATSRASNFTAA